MFSGYMRGPICFGAANEEVDGKVRTWGGGGGVRGGGLPTLGRGGCGWGRGAAQPK